MKVDPRLELQMAVSELLHKEKHGGRREGAGRELTEGDSERTVGKGKFEA